MILFRGFVFAAPPRTGSTWFIHACSDCGLGVGSKSRLHIPFPNDLLAFSVSLVRHPYDWLVSYHKALQGGAVSVPEIDQLCEISKRNISPESFIRDYLEECPGQVTRIFDSYRASSVLRLEDFPWAVVEFFQSLGVKGTPLNRIAAMPPINSVKGPPHPVDRKLKRLVVDAEEVICERYDYF